MIQYITYSTRNEKINGKDLTVNALSQPQSLDEFDIDIIDLSNAEIWRSDNDNIGTINCINDFRNLKTMIYNRKKAEIVLVFPQDYIYGYGKVFDGRQGYKFSKSANLKNILKNLETIISEIAVIPINSLTYENTRTLIGDFELTASFHFKLLDLGIKTLTNSVDSKKQTTILYKNIYMTTLKIETNNQLIAFLRNNKLIKDREEVPTWLQSFYMFDDEQQKKSISENENIIHLANVEISEAKNIIDKNNEYKSILYTNGDQLVHTVFDIMQQLLNYNLAGFVDEKKEDFDIKLNDVTFVGEIKGVTSNIKSEHVSQLDVHLNGYFDKLRESGTTENVKSLLIIDHQRNKELSKREPVHEIQIDLAKRNGSLIIETITLLKLFEKFKIGDLTTEGIKNMFINNVGLLEL